MNIVSGVLVVLSISATLCSGGSLFLAGGNVKDDDAIYGGMVAAAGGRNAAVAVITAASADGCCGPDSSWALYEPLFRSYGARDVVWIPIDLDHIENNHNPAVVKTLTESSLFFFSGGDQVRVTFSTFFRIFQITIYIRLSLSICSRSSIFFFSRSNHLFPSVTVFFYSLP